MSINSMQKFLACFVALTFLCRTTIGFSTPRGLQVTQAQLQRLPERSTPLFEQDIEFFETEVEKPVNASTEMLTNTETFAPGEINTSEVAVSGEGGSNKKSLGLIALTALASVAAAAKVGILSGPLLADGSFGAYTNTMIARDAGVATLCAGLAYTFVKTIEWLAEKEILQPRDSRKIIHTLSAPLFMVFWPAFSDAEGARFFAGVVAFINALRLVLAGLGDDKSLASAVSRSGDAKEALGGPFLYVLILLSAILTFWRSSPVGIIAVSTMAAGDGLADIIGRRYGKNNKWPFNRDKSVAGSLAFWTGGTACSVALLAWMQFTGCLPMDGLSLANPLVVAQIALITGISAFIELIPGVDDNWVVPLSAAVLTMILLQ